MTWKERFAIGASTWLVLAVFAISPAAAQTAAAPAKPQSETAYRRGLAADQAGLPEDAIAAYSKAVEFDPTNALAWQARGKDYLALQDWTKAASDLEQYVKLLPGESEGHAVLGQVYSHFGRHQDSVAEFTRAIRLKPGE